MEVEGLNLQLPFYRHRGWRIADRLIAGLILQLPGNRNRFPRPELCAEAITRFRERYRDILRDPEPAFKHWDLLLDRLQVKDLGTRVIHGCSFDSPGGVQDKLDRFVPRHSWRINVDTRWKLDFSRQGDPAAGGHGAIGLCQGESKMRRLDILAHFLGEFGEELSNDIVRREAVRVLDLEIRAANNAFRVDVEESGVRHPLVPTFRFRIEDVEAAKQDGIRICKQRKLDLMPVSKVFQDRRTVVTDRGEFDSLSFKSLFGILQLHELRFAEGSPIRGTEEEEDCPF